MTLKGFIQSFVICFLLFGSMFKSGISSAQQRVGLELVLAIDTSTSVDQYEYDLQRDGIANAFRHPKVQVAIESLGDEGMAVSIVQWAGQANQVRAVDWHLVNSAETAIRFADKVASMKRQMRGFTDIANAINFSVREIETNQFDGRRLTIDVSGDGTSDRNDPSVARDAAILKGMTINGLVIHTFEYDLGEFARFELQKHFEEQVIGGPGAFLLHAESFRDFAKSIREKLFREISGPLFANNVQCIEFPSRLCTATPARYMITQGGARTPLDGY